MTQRLKSSHLFSARQRAGACAPQHCPVYLSTSVVVQGSAGSSSAHPTGLPVWTETGLAHEANQLMATLATVLRCALTAVCAALEMQDWTSDTRWLLEKSW